MDKSLAAATLGRIGGKVKSKVKSRAARNRQGYGALGLRSVRRSQTVARSTD